MSKITSLRQVEYAPSILPELIPKNAKVVFTEALQVKENLFVDVFIHFLSKGDGLKVSLRPFLDAVVDLNRLLAWTEKPVMDVQL